MRMIHKGPRGGEPCGREQNSIDDNIPHGFALCKLRNTRIVDSLPAGCPMATPAVLGAIGLLETRGFQRLLAPGPDRDEAGGLADLARAKACETCIGQLLSNSHVQRLRALEGRK